METQTEPLTTVNFPRIAVVLQKKVLFLSLLLPKEQFFQLAVLVSDSPGWHFTHYT